MATQQVVESTQLVFERVDRETNTIFGAKLVGLRSKNGRRYTEQALREAISLYEGASIFTNHPKGHPGSPRDYQDRVAGISGVTFKSGEGLFGNLTVNPKAPAAEAMLWDAEHNTKGVGLSHNVMCESRQENGETVIESIGKVNSVDLVAGPATTNSMFEQHDANGNVAEPDDWTPTPASHFTRMAGGRGRHHQTENEGNSMATSLLEKLRGIASGNRYGSSIVLEGECMDLNVHKPGDDSALGKQIERDVQNDKADIARLTAKIDAAQEFSADEKQRLLKLLRSGDSGAIEQVTEAIDLCDWQPTTTDKYRRLARM